MNAMRVGEIFPRERRCPHLLPRTGGGSTACHAAALNLTSASYPAATFFGATLTASLP